MKLLKRSTIVAVALAGLLAAGTGSASAIVGGRDATQGYPGMAAMSVYFPGLGTARCGASLVHPHIAPPAPVPVTTRFVLTAAHCVSDQDAAPAPVPVAGKQVTVRVGSLDRTTGGVVATGTRVYLYPDWAWGFPTGKPVGDLALIELDRAIRLPVLPIAGRQPGVGDPVRLVGWGLTVYPPPPGTTIPAMLQEHDTTRLPNDACTDGFIGAGEICVGGGACYGDSGSPALHRTLHGSAANWRSVGIASRGINEHCGADTYTVYTDPTYQPFRTWIYTTIFHRKPLPCTCPPPIDSPASQARMTALKLKHFH